jgi:hypothetical protein
MNEVLTVGLTDERLRNTCRGAGVPKTSARITSTTRPYSRRFRTVA